MWMLCAGDVAGVSDPTQGRRGGAYPTGYICPGLCAAGGGSRAAACVRSLRGSGLSSLPAAGAFVRTQRRRCCADPAAVRGTGLFLSFSVCCFAASLGREGVLLALAALGLRCLFVLPCMLYLSGAGFSRACRSLERGQAAKAAINWRMLLFCVFVLLAGTVVECAIVPKFSRLFWRGCLRERGEGI